MGALVLLMVLRGCSAGIVDPYCDSYEPVLGLTLIDNE